MRLKPPHILQTLQVVLLLLLVACQSHENTGPKNAADEPSKPVRADKNYLTDCRVLYAEARKMDSILLGQLDLDTLSANSAIVAFTEFANYCQSDTMAPVYLIKTAQVARAINNIPQAKVVLDKCVNDYPAFDNRPAALFMLAQLYDEDTYLNNEPEAKRLYEQILADHPKSAWALSARGALAFIGKSDEEIMREFKKKSAQQERKRK